MVMVAMGFPNPTLPPHVLSVHPWQTREDRRRRRRRGSGFRFMMVSLGPSDLSYELDDGFSRFILPLPPGPLLFPRKTLNPKFAVLLMRSAYDAADYLDFIPMDKFQVKFWKLRQSEVEPYTLQHSPLKVKYGDLTDPLYFDFISFSQFSTISNEMRRGEIVFQEKNGAYGELKTVRRNANFMDNSLLPLAFTRRAGDLIYERLVEGFEGEGFNIPRPCPPSSSLECVLQGIKQIMQLFVDQGYALNGSIEEIGSGKNDELMFRTKIEGSATLWGMRTLASRGASILTNFEALVMQSFVNASLHSSTFNIRLSDTLKEELWTIK